MADKNRILIADDNQPNRELLEAYLADVDCEIDHAADGQETLAKVKTQNLNDAQTKELYKAERQRSPIGVMRPTFWSLIRVSSVPG